MTRNQPLKQAYTVNYDGLDADGEQASFDEIVEAMDIKDAIEVICLEAQIEPKQIQEVAWLGFGIVRRGSNKKLGS